MSCERCHGEGVITVNESWAKCGPDPQLDRDERCPDCHGTGQRIVGDRWALESLVAYMGKADCADPRCRRAEPVGCMGYHCAVCHEPCGMTGHAACRTEAA